MLFAGRLTPGWKRYFYRIPEPVPPGLSASLRPNRLRANDAPNAAPRPAAQPFQQGGPSAKPGTARGAPPPLRLGWRPWELEVLVAKLSPVYRAAVLDNLRGTLEFRTHSYEPPKRPKDAPLDDVQRSRFGLLGERLQGKTPDDLVKALCTELREITWTLETASLRLVRNDHLAMHSIRLGQLAWELDRRRPGSALEKLRDGLMPLWEEV